MGKAINEFDSPYFESLFCFKKISGRNICSSDREKLLKFEVEGQEFVKFLRSLEQFIQTVKGQNKFWEQNAFLTCS